MAKKVTPDMELQQEAEERHYSIVRDLIAKGDMPNALAEATTLSSFYSSTVHSILEEKERIQHLIDQEDIKKAMQAYNKDLRTVLNDSPFEIQFPTIPKEITEVTVMKEGPSEEEMAKINKWREELPKIYRMKEQFEHEFDRLYKTFTAPIPIDAYRVLHVLLMHHINGRGTITKNRLIKLTGLERNYLNRGIRQLRDIQSQSPLVVVVDEQHVHLGKPEKEQIKKKNEYSIEEIQADGRLTEIIAHNTELHVRPAVVQDLKQLREEEESLAINGTANSYWNIRSKIAFKTAQLFGTKNENETAVKLLNESIFAASAIPEKKRLDPEWIKYLEGTKAYFNNDIENMITCTEGCMRFHGKIELLFMGLQQRKYPSYKADLLDATVRRG